MKDAILVNRDTICWINRINEIKNGKAMVPLSGAHEILKICASAQIAD